MMQGLSTHSKLPCFVSGLKIANTWHGGIVYLIPLIKKMLSFPFILADRLQSLVTPFLAYPTH